MVRRVGLLALGFGAVNASLFAAYRFAFLDAFAPGAGAADRLRAHLYGLRLDVALLGLEGCVLGIVCLGLGSVRLRALYGFCVGWTLLNAFVAFADYHVYAERGQHMGAILLANVGEGDSILAEVSAFLSSRAAAAAALAVGLPALLVMGLRLGRRVPRDVWRLAGSPRRWTVVAGATALAFATLLEPFGHVDRPLLKRLTTLDVTGARHYALLDNYLLHQAIPNPLLEIVAVDLPGALQPPPGPRLPEATALALALEALGRTPEDDRYPLLVETDSDLDLGIENVVVIQVESLTSSILDRREGDRWVMPFVRGLAEEGLWFTRAIQGFSNTAGGMFCTCTGLPRTALGESAGGFTPTELSGYYGTLPRCLGDGWEAWSFSGFRMSSLDYRAFMGNQGYRALVFRDFYERLEALGRTGADDVDVLGVRDGPFLEECARILLASRRPFVAHAMTTSTHPPWGTPASFESELSDRRLTAYRYADDCIRRFVDALAADPDLLRKTLLVVVADHTNLTFGDDRMERFRIPLVFWSPVLRERGLAGRREAWATHADVLPTVLALLGGRRRYAGMGRNLLEAGPERGILSSTLDEGFYFRGAYALEWRPFPEEWRLLTVSDASLGVRDVSAEHPDVFAAMQREYCAQYETARRLAGQRRILPLAR
jgi:hypothetical protein